MNITSIRQVFLGAFLTILGSQAFATNCPCGDKQNPCPKKSDVVIQECPKSTGDLNIGVSMWAEEGVPFFDELLDGAMNQSENYSQLSIALQVLHAGRDQSLQFTQLNDIIATGVDALIVQWVGSVDESEQIASKADQAGIPVVFVGGIVPPDTSSFPNRSVFVAMNESEAGAIQGREICRILGDKGISQPNIAIIGGVPGAVATAERTRGVRDAISGSCQSASIVSEVAGNWDRQMASQVAQSILTSHRVDAIVANNDEMALGAIYAISQGGQQDSVVIGGIDGLPEALDAIQTEGLAVSVFLSPGALGAWAMNVAIDLASGEDRRSPVVTIPVEAVTKDNVSDFE